MSLTDEITACNRCPLRQQCYRVVPGYPALGHYPLMIVGEHPKSEEDLFGEPFRGREGVCVHLLLRNAGVGKQDYYTTLMVKCKPKGVTFALPEESIQACRQWLWQEIQAVQPRVIITLGKGPTRLLLKLPKTFRLQDVAGDFRSVDYMSCLVAPWYGPNYILNQGRDFHSETVSFFQEARKRASVRFAETVVEGQAGV